MFELIFGIVWLSFCSIIFIPIFIMEFVSKSSQEILLIQLLIFLLVAALFYGIGIWSLIKGIKKAVKDSKTKKYGIETFGKILHIKSTGNYVNGIPELAAEIATYDSEINDFLIITESIGGYNNSQYQLGTYVELKYYEDDINIIRVIDSSNISSFLLKKLDEKYPINELNPKELIIDGVRYIRADLVEDLIPLK